MAKKHEPGPDDRIDDYLKLGEAAAMYLNGVSDALEISGEESVKEMVHHLRFHAHELSAGTLWVRHGYREAKAK